MNQLNSKTYILKIIVYIFLSTFVVDKIIYFTLQNISNQVFSGNSVGKLNQFLKIKDNVDLLFFGSSRAEHHIDPQLISNKAFNMGVANTHIAYTSTLIKTLSNKEQLILIHIDPYHAFDSKYSAKDINLLKVKYHQNEIIKNEIKKINSYNLNDFYWSLDYNSLILGILRNYITPRYNYHNFFGYSGGLDIRAEAELKKIIDNSPKKECNENFYMNDYYKIYLDDIKKISEKQNKTIVIFSSPIFIDYCKKDNLIFEKVMKGMNFQYYDFTDIFKDNENISYWMDRTHLSKIGAKKFTEIIYKEIDQFKILK